jgi:DNA polymerase elongation subunit (family B)
MQQYYRNQNCSGIDINQELEFQIIEWHTCDENDNTDENEEEENEELNEKYTIRCFGVTNNNKSITCKITDFTPFYYIKVPESFNNVKLRYLINYIKDSFQMKKKINDTWCEYYSKSLIESKCSIVQKKDLFGFRNGKLYKFVRLVFDNFTALNKSKYIFKNAIMINNINDKPMKYKLYESNFEPFMRFCHMKDIRMAGWVKLKKYKLTYDEANTEIQVTVNYKELLPLNDKQDIANYLQASWDIETYSFDYSFPDPNKMVKTNSNDITFIYPNVIYQIATTFKYYQHKDNLVKHIFTLKKCDKIDDLGVIVEECIDEKDLIMRWCEMISNMDPDIMYTYNGDQFDCRYLIERAKLYKLGDYLLLKLSRLVNIKTVVKKETFSSSAYGDSEFIRFYIPGRLNYDLLIHYKRGMKKYPSYKLNYIAEQILNETKNDISAKQIFEYYKNGKSDQIRDIAKYCFVEGTRVSLPSCSVDIKCLDKNNSRVITWVENKGFSTSEKTHFFNNGEKECIQITLIDGTQLSCTKDHKFLTKDGWVEAQDLLSTHKILFYPEHAYCDYEKEYLQTFKFSDLIGTLSYEKSCILVRILGYLLTDGCISDSTCYKNYLAGRIKYIYTKSCIFLGTKLDAENMQKDIYILINKSPAINKDKHTYRITLPMELTKMFLSLKGVEKGRRLDSSVGLPNFIKENNCPIWIVREFLKGLMGGDGSCPTFSKRDNRFSTVNFGQSKTQNNLDTLLIYMTELQSLFERFNLYPSISKVYKNKKGEGYTQILRLKPNETIDFYEKIGYAYCVGKTYKLAVASSYYKLKRETKRQFNWVCKRVKQLKTNLTIQAAIDKAHSELKAQEPIFNVYYSLPKLESINLNPSNESYFKKIHFPSITDYLLFTESYDKFVTNTTKKSHAVKSDDQYSPCYYLSILHKKEIGKQKVYDIEVKDTHNFVANGAVVHNCIQDTALLQKLVDKQLILITIIQLANVTFVPISFLTTRGQTIKVFSQLLRKARQMNFLVPHTNFNEDSYSILIKTKEPHNYDLSDINNYIEIDLGNSQHKSTSGYQVKKMNGKLVEIIDENNLALNINIELASDKNYFNLKAKYKNNEFYISRLTIDDEAIDGSFTGATVLTAIPGIYRDNICVLDFSSLYPTCEISRNLCYSTLVLSDENMPKSEQLGIFTENGIKYERFKWDDKIEYTLNHSCESIMKTGKNVGNMCGKPAFFEITPKHTIQCLTDELNVLKEDLKDLEVKKEISNLKIKIKKKEKDILEFKKQYTNIEKINYYCRTHDTIKNSRPEEEKFQKKDVSYNFVVAQPSIKDGEEINKGVIPSLLEELYAERKRIKKLMEKASSENNKLLEDIYNSSQLAVKISLNSVYGFVSRNRGNLIMKPLGQITTYIGRTLIEQSKNYAEQEFADYIKNNNLLTQKIEFNQEIVDSINENEKEIILEQFQTTCHKKNLKVLTL